MVTYLKRSEYLIDVFDKTTQQQVPIGEICFHPICGWIFFDLQSYERIQDRDLETLKDLIVTRILKL